MSANSNVTEKKRNLPSTAFKEGQSGNPTGRPKKTEEQLTLEAMCRDKTPQALTTILELMEDADKDSTRLSAAQYIIDRGWGKAAQAVSVTGSEGGPVVIEIVKRIVDPNRST